MIKVIGSYPPIVFQSPTGKWYVTPTVNGWVEVPAGTTLADIEWTPSFTVQTKTVKPRVEKVKSSDGKRVYLVTTFQNGSKTCTCPGFTFRRFCKHTGAK